MSNEIMDLVQIMNDQAVTTSLKVAEYFDKQHSHVLDTIKSILAVENSATKFFFESTYENRGKQYPQYLMNRDGFSLLVMGFTGAKALKWKIKFIEAFNAMESKLKYGTDKVPQTFLEALKLAVQKEEERLALEAAYKDEKKRADDNQEYKDLAIAATDNEFYYSLNIASKCLDVQNMGRNKLFKFLRDEGVLNAENCPYQQYINDRYFVTKFNYDFEFYVTRISPKGMKYVLKKLVANGFTPNMTVEQWEQACRDEIKSLQNQD